MPVHPAGSAGTNNVRGGEPKSSTYPLYFISVHNFIFNPLLKKGFIEFELIFI